MVGFIITFHSQCSFFVYCVIINYPASHWLNTQHHWGTMRARTERTEIMEMVIMRKIVLAMGTCISERTRPKEKVQYEALQREADGGH